MCTFRHCLTVFFLRSSCVLEPTSYHGCDVNLSSQRASGAAACEQPCRLCPSQPGHTEILSHCSFLGLPPSGPLVSVSVLSPLTPLPWAGIKLALGQSCFLATHGNRVGAVIFPEQCERGNWQGLVPSLGIWPAALDCIAQRETSNHFVFF